MNKIMDVKSLVEILWCLYLFKKFGFIFTNYVHVSVLMSVGVHGGQKRAAEPLDLGSQMIVSPPVLGLGTQVLWKSTCS